MSNLATKNDVGFMGTLIVFTMYNIAENYIFALIFLFISITFLALMIYEN